ncbi:hypothetical protein FO519_004918 [Halicephalobus sp. NKZ332]|nr:hypothetical protein FO519_004918 [Halicephalobus sp. NKZ332]
MFTERYINRILLFLLQIIINSRTTIATKCINEIQLDGQFDSCRCTKVGPEGHISLNCDNQQWITVPSIHKAFGSNKKDIVEIVAISIKDGFLMYISQDAFRNSSAQNIDLSQNFIENINVNAFRGLEDKLFQLLLNQNSLSAIPYHSLTYLQQLRYLYLQQNQITDIPPQTFANVKLENLKYLHLDTNKISLIQKGALTNLPLQVLTISNNKITDLEKDSISKSLWFIDLKHNLLQHIPYLALKELNNLKTLDLESNNITHITAHKEVKFEKEMTLLLSNNKIHFLPSGAFDSFTQFTKLDLSYNQISKIDEQAFRSITKLEEINLSYNNIAHIPVRTFDNQENSLKKLNLEENDLHSLPTGLKSLSVLEVLNLNSNKLTDLQNDAMYKFKRNLTELLVAFNRLTEIPYDVLEGMDQLKHLDLSKNRIKDLDDIAFGSLPNLVRLNLAGNFLRKITNNHIFNSLRALAYLDLSYNRLKILGKTAFEKLTGLESLFLQSNSLVEFPRAALSGLDKLRYLLLDHNHIKTIPNFAVQWLTHLERLSLSRNHIQSIGEKTFRAAPMQLKSLNLGYNQISELSSRAFDSLPSLEQLLLNNNLIVRLLPQTITNLNALRDLTLAYNEIIDISEYTFVNLPHLEHLSLAHNDIRQIPRMAFSSTPKLEVLDLSYNNFKHFDSDFLETAIKLIILDLSHNKISRSLKHLNISRNKIYEIQPNDIELLKRVTVLDASWNDIVEIKADILKQMTELEYLDLTGNSIRIITAHQLEQLDQLEVLKIAHLKNLEQIPEPFQFAKLRNLKQLEIHNLPLSEFQYNISHILQVLPPLKIIDIEIIEPELKHQLKRADLRLLRSITIRGKKLKQIAPTAFDKLRGYRLELIIRDTEITNIPPLTFHTMHSISFLSLSLTNNKIQRFNPFTHTKPPLLNQHGTILERINLEGNPVLCTCEMQWIKQWLEYTSEHSTQLETIQSDLDKTECDARPGIQDTLLSVYGSGIPGIKSQHIPTITVNEMCDRYLGFNGQNYPQITKPILVILFSYLVL